MKAILLALAILPAIQGSAAPVFTVQTCYTTNGCNQHDSSKRITVFPSYNCSPSTCMNDYPWRRRPYCDTKCMPDFTSSMSYAESALTEHPYVVEYDPGNYLCNATTSAPQRATFFIVAKGNCLVIDDGTGDKPARSAIWSITSTGDVDSIRYAGINCNGDPIGAFRVSAADVTARTCIESIDTVATIYSIGGVTPLKERRYAVKTYYSDSTCSTVSSINYKLESTLVDWDCSTSGSNCQLLPDGHYGKITCISATNYAQFAASAFGSTPYMIAKRYYNTDCSVDYGLLAYRADGSTINVGDGVKGKFQLMNDSYNATTFVDGEPTGSFSASFSELAVICMGGNRYYPYNAPTSDLATTTNSTTGQGNGSSKLKSIYSALLSSTLATLQ
ncbi:hypothetical protein PHYBOEH_004449 [Phytophthora boehmeriae]|uniref:Uncharacterized protein n=1 Tax=Phytophthora boehmeriae TaxID=109152 RepID=A0A8T1WRG6_9STRA|nr:hypothetical protein PHYBOEH_004449 [Phytophthora boehmeriae]